MLKDQIQKDMIASMKARDTLKADALKMIKSEIMKHEVSSADAEATDEVVMDILKKAVKQRKEAAKGFLQGGRDDMALKEEKEAEIYEAYLPEMMKEEEIQAHIDKVIEEVGATGPQDTGKVMGKLMSELQGKADGGVVKELVQKKLSSM